MIMRKSMKKILCIVISLLVVFSSVSVAAAASAPSYPAGVTAQQALNAVKGTDKLLSKALPILAGKSLKGLITSSLYTSDTLSGILVSVYSSMEESGDALKIIGIDASTRAVAQNLRAYPDVCAELFNCESWSSVNLEGASWKVKNKSDFAKALGAIFAPFNDILYTLLCGGSYEMNKYVTIKGGEGYGNAVIPLYESLKITSYYDSDTFILNAQKNKNTMVQNLVIPVLTWLEKVASSPANTLTDSLPSFAYYVDSGKFNKNFQLLLKPITSNPLVEIAAFLKILDLESFNIDVNTLISSLSEEGALKLAPVDFSNLAACGKNTSKGYKANKGLATFDLSSLRWNKVIICTDADVDGFQIRTLILTMIYRLMPTLITEGKIYIAETPLYEIGTKEMTYFAYDEKEKNEILAQIGDKKYSLQRSKGLGENQPDMMNMTTMNPESRRLIKVMPQDAERTARMFDLLLGDDLQGRKDFIAENGYIYLDDADIS